jgi:malate dehydrogenase (oxaloacetate-decarboxylating)
MSQIINEQSEKLHRELQGKIEIRSKTKVHDKHDLALVYTPGVAHVSSLIAQERERAYEFTGKGNTIAIISDGTAVLGLGDIGPEAALPVMEGKALLLKEFSGINGVPIVLSTKNTEEIIKTITHIAPGFGGIILEDFSAPRCFEIESRLQQLLDIPVIHDDQHGIAIVVLAALINSLTLRDESVNKDIKIVVSGTGAAGIAVIRLLNAYGFNNIVGVDSKGIISRTRENLDPIKTELLYTCLNQKTPEISGLLNTALQDADVCIGLSVGNTINETMIASMQKKPIIFALANPTPEIDPLKAQQAGAFIVGTGRSDYPNQLNNALVFPGLMKGALEGRIGKFSQELFLQVAEILATYQKPTIDAILPDVFDKNVVNVISEFVLKTYGKK